MSKKNSSRPVSTSKLSQPLSAAALARSQLHRLHPSAAVGLYAQVSRAVDADTVRIYETTTSGRCVGRWATEIGASSSSSGSSSRIESAEWVELRSSPVVPQVNGTPSKRSKKRRKSAGAAEAEEETVTAASTPTSSTHALALGMTNGTIVILHPTQSTVIKTLSHPSSTSPIRSLCFSDTQLWSAATDGSILVWTVPRPDGSGGALIGRAAGCGSGWSHLSVLSISDTTARLLVGAQAVKILDVAIPSTANSEVYDAVSELDQTIVATCTGHATDISQFISLPSTDASVRFATTAEADRTVSIWSLTSGAPEALLVANLSLDVDVASAIAAEDGRTLAAIGLAQSSVGLFELNETIFTTPASSESSKKKSKSRIHLLKPTSEIALIGTTDSIVSGVFDGPSAQLRLVRGTLKPAFEDTNGALLPRIELDRKLSKGKGAAVDGENDSPGQRARYTESGVVVQSASAGPSIDDLPRINEGAIEGEDLNATLAQRLRGLKVARKPAAEADDDAAMDEDGVVVKPAASEPTLTLAPSATLGQTLVQALHSSDRGLLETCLAHSDTKIIRNTVKRVPTQLVLPLVEALVERLGRSKRGYGAGVGAANVLRGRALTQWLRAVLVVHVGYLVTVPTLIPRLAALHTTLDSRLALHDRLLALNGRLELVVSQIDLQREAHQPVASTSRAAKPVTRYVEGESEDDEDLIAMDDDDDTGSIEDIALATPSALDEDDTDDSDENAASDFEVDEPGLAAATASAKRRRPVNGYMDIEAAVDDDEDDDESEEDETAAPVLSDDEDEIGEDDSDSADEA